jgi:hypothetical protein
MTPPSTGHPVADEPDRDPTGSDPSEVLELRAEVEHLRARLDTRGKRAAGLLALRRVAAAALVAVTALAVVGSVIGLWGAYTMLNTNRFVSTVAPLPEDPTIAAAVSQYSTDQLFDALDVQQRVEQVLPPRAAFVAGPLAGQVHDAIEKTVSKVLRSNGFQKVWNAAIRQAHEQTMTILNGTSAVVVAGQETVRINLLPLINQVIRLLSDQLPTLFGKKITLPDISSGQIPANLRARVQDALGVTLPPNFAEFTVYDAGKLKAAQRAVVTLKRSLVALVIGTLLLFVLALFIAPRRRRTVLHFGLWLVIAAVAVTAVLRAVKGQVLAQVPEGLYRDAAADTITTVTALPRVRGQQLIWLGAIVAMVCYLIGPGRGPVWLRRHAATAARAGGRWSRQGYRTVTAHGPGLTERHLDAVRISGLVPAVVFALILSSWTSLLIIVVLLAVFEIVVTVIARRRAGTGEPTRA